MRQLTVNAVLNSQLVHKTHTTVIGGSPDFSKFSLAVGVAYVRWMKESCCAEAREGGRA